MIATNHNNAEITSYWNLIKDVKDDIKIRLITLLSESLSRSLVREHNEVSARTNEFIDNIYGSLKGPDTAEELIAIINENKSCKAPVSFD